MIIIWATSRAHAEAMQVICAFPVSYQQRCNLVLDVFSNDEWSFLLF